MTSIEERGSNELLTLWEYLRQAGAVTEISLQLPIDLNYNQYEALGIMLGRVKRSTSWLIGDFILYGEETYGEVYAQAADLTGLAPQSLANYASVCRHIPPNRRRIGVPFGVHAEVAYLEPQERDRWLDRAEQGQWTRAKLREEMRALREGEIGPDARSGESGKIGESREEHPDSGVPAISGGFLGEPESGPIHTCPNCGYDLRPHLSLGE